MVVSAVVKLRTAHCGRCVAVRQVQAISQRLQQSAATSCSEYVFVCLVGLNRVFCNGINFTGMKTCLPNQVYWLGTKPTEIEPRIPEGTETYLDGIKPTRMKPTLPAIELNLPE